MRRKKFEDALKELELIINNLENRELGLDDSLKLFRDGVELYQYCHNELDEAEKKISMIIDENGEIKQIPFEEREDY
ncbi:exodeoxyribonuclease VII small subunit [Alkaliphilus peptidifermentans]|uniref:Exodeoxyribonuclease 7 small subunit n=1 Tax=Alkaliphilus peptidifermentans DSM 18978 TaxID=1120976 RepID=A0A1G5KDL7_9FIRM|nr:exodeoxyribonuclease VII small subunit [Alkaliphilus peptidifermentans]SCY98723.1 Exodeoxyribonuclease VII small subunit [Alkaliphilus peptidifermentans DSM 18978]